MKNAKATWTHQKTTWLIYAFCVIEMCTKIPLARSHIPQRCCLRVFLFLRISPSPHFNFHVSHFPSELIKRTELACWIYFKPQAELLNSENDRAERNKQKDTINSSDYHILMWRVIIMHGKLINSAAESISKCCEIIVRLWYDRSAGEAASVKQTVTKRYWSKINASLHTYEVREALKHFALFSHLPLSSIKMTSIWMGFSSRMP